MRPRWLSVILFALALAVQALAPVAIGMPTTRGLELAGLSEICLKAREASDSRHDTPSHTHRCQDCALCQAFCDGVTPVAGRPFWLGAPPSQWTKFHWAATIPGLPTSPRDYARQARAPPVFS